MNFIELNEYDFWANSQILKILIAHRDLKEANDLYYHILEANVVWYERLIHQKIDTNVWSNDYDFELFEAKTVENYMNMKAYLESKSSLELESNIDYTTLKGDPYSNCISEILFHVFNHSTHHRAQIMTLLKQEGLDRPSLDYIFYKRNKK